MLRGQEIVFESFYNCNYSTTAWSYLVTSHPLPHIIPYQSLPGALPSHIGSISKRFSSGEAAARHLLFPLPLT